MKKTKNKGGRPLKVGLDEFKAKAEEYLAECKRNNISPLLKEFALNLDISDDSLTGYSNRIGYSDTIKRIRKLGEIALGRKVEKTGSIGSMFLLKAIHGYSDRQQIDITSNGKDFGVVMLPKR